MDWAFKLFHRLMEHRSRWLWNTERWEQRIVAIAIEAKSLMVDGPSIGLAPMISSEVFRPIKQIGVSRVTIFLLEQNVYHSLKIAGKAFVLEHC